MSFVAEYVNGSWAQKSAGYDTKDLNNWESFLSAVEKDRQRDRILAWRDRTTADDFAVNAEEPEFYRRTATFVWRIRDPSGKHKARNHQYLYNLEVLGHKQVSRRDKSELAAAQAAVEARVSKGELGALSPLA